MFQVPGADADAPACPKGPTVCRACGTRATGREIDRLVYELYGLTLLRQGYGGQDAEEIRIVEEARPQGQAR